MSQSESIAKLAEALAKAQGLMEGASKDSINPFFKSKYADLSSVWDACRKPLSENGLSIVQISDFLPDNPDMVCIETILCHTSGEWIKGKLAVKPVKPDPQSVGSCITYLRRYSLQSMVGIAPEDDDGNAASGEDDKEKKMSSPQLPPTPSPVAPEPPSLLVPGSDLHKQIEAKIGEAGINRELLKQYLFDKGKIGIKDDRPSLTTMTIENAEKMIKAWGAVLRSYEEWRMKQGEWRMKQAGES